MANQWFLIKGQAESGPFGGKELKQMALKGNLKPSDRLRNSVSGKIVQAMALNGLEWPESNNAVRSNDSVKSSASQEGISNVNTDTSIRLSDFIGNQSSGIQSNLSQANNQQVNNSPQILGPSSQPSLQGASPCPMPPPVYPPQIPVDKWFIHQNGNQFGPILGPDLHKLMATKQIGLDALAWKDGMANWLPISQLFQNQIGAPPNMPSGPGAFVNMGYPNPQLQPFGSSGGGFKIPSFLLDIHLQRKVLAILSIVGLIGVCLPWFSFNPMQKASNLIPGFEAAAALAESLEDSDMKMPSSYKALNKTTAVVGYSATSGVIALLVFSIGALSSILGQRSQALEGGAYRAATLLPMFGGAICAWHIARFLLSGIYLKAAIESKKMPESPNFFADPFYGAFSAGIGLYLGLFTFFGVIFWRQIYWFAFTKSK